MTAGPLGLPRKGERKVGGFKNPEGGSDEANRLIRTVFTNMYSSKGHISHFRYLKQDAGGVQITKPTPVIKGFVTIP